MKEMEHIDTQSLAHLKGAQQVRIFHCQVLRGYLGGQVIYPFLFGVNTFRKFLHCDTSNTVSEGRSFVVSFSSSGRVSHCQMLVSSRQASIYIMMCTTDVGSRYMSFTMPPETVLENPYVVIFKFELSNHLNLLRWFLSAFIRERKYFSWTLNNMIYKLGPPDCKHVTHFGWLLTAFGLDSKIFKARRLHKTRGVVERGIARKAFFAKRKGAKLILSMAST